MRIPKIVEIVLGEPWKLRENGAAIAIPLLLKEKAKERRYRLLSEVRDQVRLVDTGRIDKLQVVNGSTETVFIRKGSIVKGDTQTRAITLSIVVAPMYKTQADIKCVYASKGIRGGANFEFSGKYTPNPVTESLRASQGETWSKVHEYTAKIINESTNIKTAPGAKLNELHRLQGTDNLEGYLAAEENIIDEAMKNIPADHVRQVGLVVVDIQGIAGLEFFDHPDAWRALSQSVTRNYAEILAQMASDIFEINMEKAKLRVEEFIKQLQEMEGTASYKEGPYETYEMMSERLSGEFTTIYGDLIHVLVAKRENVRPPPPTPRQQPTIYERSFRRSIDPRLDSYNVNKNKISMHPSINIQEINNGSTQNKAAGIVEYLTKKRGYETIIALRESPQTFNELQKKTTMSTATITKAVREAEELGLVHKSYRQEKSSTVYELTETGKALQPEKFKATLED